MTFVFFKFSFTLSEEIKHILPEFKCSAIYFRPNYEVTSVGTRQSDTLVVLTNIIHCNIAYLLFNVH